MKAYRENGGTAPLILNLGTRWRWVVLITPSSDANHYPSKRVHGPQSLSGCFAEEINLLCLKGIELHFPRCTPTALYLYRLRYPGSQRNTTPSFMLSSVETSCSLKSMTTFVQHVSRTHCYTKVGTKVVPLILFSHAP
jgi:hypothetical protein